MLFRAAINLEPEDQPNEAQRACDDERPLPAVSDGDEGNCERREDCADVRAAVKDACRQSALLLREPLRHCLNRCREVASFAKPQSETRRPEAESRARKRVAHRSD